MSKGTLTIDFASAGVKAAEGDPKLTGEVKEAANEPQPYFAAGGYAVCAVTRG